MSFRESNSDSSVVQSVDSRYSDGNPKYWVSFDFTKMWELTHVPMIFFTRNRQSAVWLLPRLRTSKTLHRCFVYCGRTKRKTLSRRRRSERERENKV